MYVKILLVVGGLLLLFPPGSAFAGGRPAAEIRLTGASPEREEVCGRNRRVASVQQGARVIARVRLRRAGRALGPARLRVERCGRSGWRGQGTLRARRPRLRKRLNTDRPGSYRLRARIRTTAGMRRSPRVYLRISRTAPGVARVPLTFAVRNENRSRVDCPSDDQAYEVRGHLLAPEVALAKGALTSVTVYMHGIGTGEWYWHFTSLPGYDFAGELAKQGHASVVYDRLGYDSSGKPDGTRTCYGSDADVASQIIARLRSGDYTAGGRAAPVFKRVALASHSIGGFMAQPAAYSFEGVDALLVTSLADQGFTPTLINETAYVNTVCSSGGERVDGSSGPGGYAALRRETLRSAFVNIEPAVLEEALRLQNRDPCGGFQSATRSIASDQLYAREYSGPVLLVNGLEDPFFTQPGAGEQQRDLYSGSDDVTLAFLEQTGHAPALERTAPEFRSLVSSWLEARGF